MRSLLPPYVWVLFALPACATYQQSQLGAGDGGLGAGGAGDPTAGSSNSAGGVSGSDPLGNNAGAQQSNGGSITAGGSSSGGATGAAGTSTGNAGAGGKNPTAGAGGANTAGASAGGAPAGGAPAGGAPAGGAPAAGAPAAGAPAAGASAGGASAGAGPTINPCDHTNWTATASESSLMMPDVYNPPPYAVDGVAGTRWSSGMPVQGGEWFLVDLGAKATHLTKVVLDTTKSAGDIPTAYKLEVSVNGTTFTQVATGAGAALTTITFADTSARYIKVTQTSAVVQTHWWSIHELTITCTP